MARVYEWLWFQRQKDHAGLEPRLVEFIPSTPYAALVVAPIAALPALEAKRVWLAANLLLLLLTGVLLHRLTSLGARRITLLALLAVTPLRDDFAFGQQHVPVLFLLTLSAWLYLAGRPASAGVALGFGAALRLYPGFFLFYFLRKKQWRGALALVASSAALALASIRLFGFASLRAFAVEVLPRALKGEDIDPYDVHWNSFTALLRRLFVAEPGLNPHPLAHLPAAYAVLQPLSVALLLVPFLWLISSSRSDRGREKLEWGGYAAMLLAISTHPAAYHFCALILTAVLATDHLLAARLKNRAGAVVLLYALVCLPLSRFLPAAPSGWRTFLSFPRLYALAALVVLLLWRMWRLKEKPLASLVRSREAAVFAAIFAALLAAGVWTNLRHLEGQFDNYASRLEGVPAPLLAGEPNASGDTIAFTMMSPTWRGYVTANLRNNSLELLDPPAGGADAFHPALEAGGSAEWIESASATSRVIRLNRDQKGRFGGPATVVIGDAEQPAAVSPREPWLAYIRETQGRGSLWVRNLCGGGCGSTGKPLDPAAPSKSDVRVADFTWDVREAAFQPGNRVVFSAAPGSQEGLFVADLKTRKIAAIQPPAGRARYPAVSPDGKWLAYAREERGDWQLLVRSLESGEDRRLTGADCNSISPAWLPDSKTLVYSTDCGRGLGLTALVKIRAVR